MDVIFSDDFTGPDGKPPHRGRWFKYVARHGSVVISNLKCEIDSNRLHLKLTESGASAYARVCAVSRAEFRVPFRFQYLGQVVSQDFFGSLVTSDIRDGYLADSHIYGKELARFGVWDGGPFSLTVVKDGVPQSHYSSVNGSSGVWYRIHGEVDDDGAYWSITLKVTRVSDGETLWQVTKSFDRGRLGTLRLRLYVYVQNGTGECLIDDVTVWGERSKRVKVGVTVLHSGEDYIMDDDVISFRILQREGAYPQASLTAWNPDGKYSGIGLTGEVEIRAGFEDMLFLLFRGYIEAPTLSYPPSVIEIESGKGYSKRLDFRETDKESWNTYSGGIVKDIVATYFTGVFTTDHVENGVSMDIDSDDENCGALLRKLAEDNGFVCYVDFNRDLHFCSPETESTYSNLVVTDERDAVKVSYRMIDEILNKITQIGKSSSYTAQDSASQAAYWLREKTFKDSGLTTSSSVQARATALLGEFKDPVTEIGVELGYAFIVELYDRLKVTCPALGLDSYEGVVKGVSYTYDSNGLRTSVSLEARPFRMSDIIGSHEEKVHETTIIREVGGGGADLSGYIPRGTITEKGSGTTGGSYATVASRTVTSGKNWVLAKIIVTCEKDSYVQYYWNGAAVSEERLVNMGLVEHFPYGAFGTMTGDGVKKFEVKAKQYADSGAVYAEIQGEEE